MFWAAELNFRGALGDLRGFNQERVDNQMGGVYHLFQGQNGMRAAHLELIWEIPVEGLSASQLAGYSQLSEKTIRDVENMKRPGSNRTWSKIIKGLNKNPGKSRTWKMSDFK